MTLAFQLAVFALIATSSILLIGVPVVFASPDGWSSNKNVVFSGNLIISRVHGVPRFMGFL
ncbi:putative photosystem II PsbZ, reaction centre, photosystem II PsbZ superfamily [Helianthus anomalus]